MWYALHKKCRPRTLKDQVPCFYLRKSVHLQKVFRIPFLQKIQFSKNYQVDEWRLSFLDLLLSSARLQSGPIWVIDSETHKEGRYNEVTLEGLWVETVSGKTAQYC